MSACRNINITTEKLLFKLCSQYAEQLVNSLLLEVGSGDEHLTWSVEYLLSSVEANVLDGVDNPLVNFVIEFIEVDILLVLILVVELAEYVDGVFGKHRSEFDILTTTADGE